MLEGPHRKCCFDHYFAVCGVVVRQYLQAANTFLTFSKAFLQLPRKVVPVAKSASQIVSTAEFIKADMDVDLGLWLSYRSFFGVCCVAVETWD